MAEPNAVEWHWHKTERHLCLQWPGERSCLSSAVLNGGLARARRVLNLRVSGAATEQPPEQALAQYCANQGWTGDSVGLMTAASMNSLRARSARVEGGTVEVLITCGLSNARRAGDPADWSEAQSAKQASPPAGTINSVVISSLSLTPAAMAEMLMLVTEAKAAVLQQLGVRSPVSGELATGTGTDSVVIVSGDGPAVRWCGKHTRLGQVVAELAMEALADSIAGAGERESAGEVRRA